MGEGDSYAAHLQSTRRRCRRGWTPKRGGPWVERGWTPLPFQCFAPADSTRESALVASGERYALTEAVEVVMIRQVEVVVMIRLDRGQVHVEHPRPWD